MPRFIIERDIPQAGSWSDDEAHAVTQKSEAVLAGLPDVRWQLSYISDDKLYCVYDAPDAQSIVEHAERGGFPANKVSEVRRIIDRTAYGK
ncbi:MAG: DUF4242 domain-containing protein [Phycisphaerae bacterium]|nr:DUF4242 domain-containing protein [Phycisphaerae bacterium]